MPERAGPSALRGLLTAMIATKEAARPPLAEVKAQLLSTHAALLAAGASPRFIAPICDGVKAGRSRHAQRVCTISPTRDNACSRVIAAAPTVALPAAGRSLPPAGGSQGIYQPGGSRGLQPQQLGSHALGCLVLGLDPRCPATPDGCIWKRCGVFKIMEFLSRPSRLSGL